MAYHPPPPAGPSKVRELLPPAAPPTRWEYGGRIYHLVPLVEEADIDEALAIIRAGGGPPLFAFLFVRCVADETGRRLLARADAAEVERAEPGVAFVNAFLAKVNEIQKGCNDGQ